ncbi:iron complex transport system ATP-binding protein [Cerasibacillus quisquiliarum]|uniref:Putative ABC transporter ATP-binding protein YclP n=1 Tax=Cerasibacillus quisquiliarum TaxID=227865 RepID=A0A511UYN7_9BACI|nr:ATP-binding cassette domain-containing protein [Cerasibacillus quisquiliarum]MBB5146927.1 iron complex transport system ATP-binding protein [Cerasibacillus quisquiliarum]GEN31750.1 putative ABC transporter ATP-binding protein YclP [Cerasibacillus quisquiliarum]
MVKVERLSKSYHDKKVIDNVSLSIEKGTITSFIGPNGAGKSTLMSMITRLIAQDEGIIEIDGKDIDKVKNNDLAKKISILKQSNSIQLKLTVRELVSFGRFPYSKGRLKQDDWEMVDQAIRYMELENIQDKYLDELSGGQCQRAHIAMVIAQDTEYIMLDEPLNNLDMRHSVQIMKILRKLVDELGKTVVIVIHDINFASCYSDHIVALKDGKIVKQGRSCDVIDRCVLKEIYDMDIDIKEVNNQRICVYF